MPPKSTWKRKRELSIQKARDAKRRRPAGEYLTEAAESEAGPSGNQTVEVSDMAELLDVSIDEEEADNEVTDPSFDLDASMNSDCEHMIEHFCEDWISNLDRDDLVSLALFLCFQLTSHLNVGETKAAELASIMNNRSHKTIREWRTIFFQNEGEVPESTQGKYQRSGIVWSREDLNKRATKYVRENADVKGRPNLTVRSFSEWVNNELLPNETLEPGFPRKISHETGRKWCELGFSVVSKKKGTFVDGHECEDVVQYRSKFLRRMVTLGFLNPSNAPTEEAKAALPADFSSPDPVVIDKTVVLFHDETAFQSNEDQLTLWAEKETSIMRPKSKGNGIMVSDFISEQHGTGGI